MTDPQNNFSSLTGSHWDTEGNVPRPLSSSLELQASHLWTTPGEEAVAEPTVQNAPTVTSLPQLQQIESTPKSLTCSKALPFIVVCALVAILAVVLFVVLVYTPGRSVTTSSTITLTVSSTTSFTTSTTTTTSSTSTTTTSTASVTTTTTTTTSACGVACAKTLSTTSSRIAYYNFNSNLNDVTGTYPASIIGTATYTTGYSGSAIVLNAATVPQLTTPAMYLYNQSFTIQFWFYLTGIATQDNAFFGQQSSPNVGLECLFLMARSGKLYMGFFNDDTTGTTTLQSNVWTHAAFVYDNDQRQRSIYLNGFLDAQTTTAVGPYLGTSGSMTIGSAIVGGNIGTASFSGYIDELMVYTRVKTSCEIMNDASLVAYFPFDGNFVDSGPNSLPLTSSGASIASGYTNQGVYLSGSSSYIQVGGLIALGQSNHSYSIAFWVNPIVYGVLGHVSGNSSGMDWCTPLINFNTGGNVVTQIYGSGSASILVGPSLRSSTWTHITQTFSTSNGERLYINGILYTSSVASTTYTASGKTDYFTFGSTLSGTYCYNPTTVYTTFRGGIDELRIYSREVSAIGVCLLAQS